MCAATAAARGRRVIVLERNERIGEKIRISGGGRCNFTNTVTRKDHYLSANPHFATSALARYTPADFIALVERHGIPWHEKTPGQLFCDGSSREIIDLFGKECAAAGVMIVTGCQVGAVSREGRFRTAAGAAGYLSDSLVVATGGLSIPTLGATDFGYRIARQFGHTINEPRPGLVPLTLDGDDLAFATGLSGVSLDAGVSCGGASFREKILFTHRGLSGPAILQVSSYWKPGSAVTIDLAPDVDLFSYLGDARAAASGGIELPMVLSDLFPKRFARAWCDRFVRPKLMAAFSNEELKGIASALRAWTIVPAGTEGFSKAEVTCGGVDTTELSSKTMESKKIPGLYFIGEVVDVTGHLGGYNFQWAWASGHAAGQFA